MTRIYLSLLLLLVTTLCATQCASAGEQAGSTAPSLAALLSDAQSVLNRYQKLDTEAACTAVAASGSNTAAGSIGLYKLCEHNRRVTNAEAESAKAAMLRARSDRNPSANDLLAIYARLEEVSGRLFDLSRDANRFEYGAVAGDASALGSKMYAELSGRIRTLENACSHDRA